MRCSSVRRTMKEWERVGRKSGNKQWEDLREEREI